MNNFAQASICITKDIFLHRTKAFNIITLVEFCSVTWTQYMEKRLQSPHLVIMCEKLGSRMKEQQPELGTASWQDPASHLKFALEQQTWSYKRATTWACETC